MLMAAAVSMAGEKQYSSMEASNSFKNYSLNYDTPVEADLQEKVEAIDTRLRGQYGMTTNDTAVGLLDLQSLRLAMLHPDRMEYAASVAKIGILLTYFQTHPDSATNLDPEVQPSHCQDLEQ